jgi:hypothetical protein
MVHMTVVTLIFVHFTFTCGSYSGSYYCGRKESTPLMTLMTLMTLMVVLILLRVEASFCEISVYFGSQSILQSLQILKKKTQDILTDSHTERFINCLCENVETCRFRSCDSY